jgi:ABC-type transport system involved in multi-copper enzyme maturation permease subunit
MTFHIVRKEVLENILSFRFILSLVLIIVIFAASGFVFVGKYRQRLQDYSEKTNKNLSGFREQSSQLYKLAFYGHELFRKPEPLTLCAEGFERSLPNYFKFDMFKISLPEVRSRTNFLLPHFSDIDWVFIISVALSFVALIFTYDSVCGEKQAGTMRQMLACSIPRHKILLGKYVGAMFTVGIPLLAGLLFNLIIVISSEDVLIGGSHWLKIVAIIFLSFLYLSIFVVLGIFFSSRTAHSANCMVVLLLVWAGLVILIPSLGRIVSDTFCRSPTRVELDRKLEETHERIWQNAEKFGKNAGACYADRDHPGHNPPARARLVNAYRDAENRVREEHHNRMIASTITARSLTCISPTVVYQRASEAVAGTGITWCPNVYRQIKRYQQDLEQFIRSKDAEDPDSLHLFFDEENLTDSWVSVSHKPVDFGTVPKFQEQDLALGESLKLAIWDIGLLALFNLMFFVAAFVSFLRYDVR